MQKVLQGEDERLYVEFRDNNGDLVNVTFPTVTVYEPDGTVLTDRDSVSLSAVAGSNESTGVYFFLLKVPAAQTVGRGYHARWEAQITGIVTTQDQPQQFEVIDTVIQNYADINTVASIAGISTYQVRQAWLDFVDNLIELKCGRDFWKHSSEVEYHTIENTVTDLLRLDKYPIIGTPTVMDDWRDSTPLTFAAASMYVDTAVGIIELYPDNDDNQYYFTKGRRTVKVTYDWGYEVVPSEVATLADAISAKLMQIMVDETDEEARVISIQMANYSEKLEPTYKAVLKKFGDLEMKLKGVVAKHKVLV